MTTSWITAEADQAAAMHALDRRSGPLPQSQFGPWPLDAYLVDPRKGERRGVVYFIQGGRNRIKIGHTVDMRERMVKLQTGSPVRLKLLGTVPGSKDLEREYHQRFGAARLHGEWFKRCPEIEAEIAALPLIGDPQS